MSELVIKRIVARPRSGSYRVYFDDTESGFEPPKSLSQQRGRPAGCLDIDIATLADLKLSRGKRLNEAESTMLGFRSECSYWQGRCLRKLATRPQSKQELLSFLNGSHVSSAAAEHILDYLCEKQYVNDQAFAEWYVRIMRQKFKSDAAVKWGLRQKGITAGIVESVLDEPADLSVNRLKDLIQKKRRSSRYQDPQKLMAYLSRQGFAYQDIKSALQQDES